ncbi:MAG: 4-(cytidine 5'-diphospho)-2-C-methyl-D-erythritol kinase [Flavobacteriaceae bacterium]
MAADPAVIVETAPAKVNLALHVVGREANGFHALETLAVFADAGDRLSVSPIAEGADRFTVQGPFSQDVPAGADNLVLKAVAAMRRLAVRGGLDIELEKHLPVASGIGGGSADAAALIRALCRMAGLNPFTGRVPGVAAWLGSDVPMCLRSQPVLARGRGEQLEPVDDFPALDAVLVNPGVGLRTADIFAALQNRDNARLDRLPDRRTPDAVLDWLAAARNDLEATAIGMEPAVARALWLIGGTEGCRLARMTGAGSTCFGLYAGAAEAEAAARDLADADPAWWVRTVRLGGAEPQRAAAAS